MVAFPIIAALIAGACFLLVVRDYRARPKPSAAAWAVAFAMFSAAAAAEAIGSLSGWTPLLARMYYLFGASLVVGYLALGELYLLAPKRIVDRLAGGLLLISTLAAAQVWQAEIGDLNRDGWDALERSPLLTAITISLNAGGTLILVGGLVYSAWRFRQRGIMRERVVGCLLIALGTLVVASGGTLTRLGSDEYFYIAMATGVALIFAGYLRTRGRQPRHGTLKQRIARSLIAAAAVDRGCQARNGERVLQVEIRAHHATLSHAARRRTRSDRVDTSEHPRTGTRTSTRTKAAARPTRATASTPPADVPDVPSAGADPARPPVPGRTRRSGARNRPDPAD